MPNAYCLVGMLDTYAYETTILQTANHLIENDMYTATSALVQNMRKYVSLLFFLALPTIC